MPGKVNPTQCEALTMIAVQVMADDVIFSIITKPSANPHGLVAGVAVMIAVSAMACQYALLRLAMPKTVSTAVMTGNLTNTVLSLMEMLSKERPLMTVDTNRLKRSLHLLIGFLVGCLVAASALSAATTKNGAAERRAPGT
jgi:fumarate hydratase class II